MDHKIEHLVVDSGAFIAGFDLLTRANNIYTTEGVVSEIKDKATLERLRTLPFDLITKHPPADDIKFVSDFSKKTGDYSSLSVVDIEVVALTSYLQKLHVGNEHLLRQPTPAKVITSGGNKSVHNMTGFYAPKKSAAGDEEEDDDESWITPDNLEEVKSRMSNIKLGEEQKERKLTVACVTTDYAMQNILLQLGLPLISVSDGRVIKKTKQFVLRCFACFKTTEEMNRKFCPKCGNMDTLKRVSVTTDQKGRRKIFVNFKKPIVIRGTRYSLPLPKGGKHSTDPILVEDQRVPQNRPSKFAVREKKVTSGIMKDSDYVTRSNPFAINDVYTRASRHKTRVATDNLVPHRPRNPNAVRKSIGSKKKRPLVL